MTAFAKPDLRAIAMVSPWPVDAWERAWAIIEEAGHPIVLEGLGLVRADTTEVLWTALLDVVGPIPEPPDSIAAALVAVAAEMAQARASGVNP